MITIAIANQKGGVGKTTTAVTLAHGLAMNDQLVLLIDMDTQGNVADSLGIESGDDLYRWLIQEKADAYQLNARINLHVVRSDKKTQILKMALTGMDFRELILEKGLKLMDAAAKFDYVVIDCAPSVDVLHTAALVVADYLIIPTKLDQFAIKGVREMLNSLATVRAASDSRCELAGIVPTFHDLVTRESHAQLLNLVKTFGKQVWAPIAQDTKCRTANREGKTLWELGGKSRALEGYKAMLEKVKALK